MTPGKQSRDRRLLAGPEVLEAEDLPQHPACFEHRLSRRGYQLHRAARTPITEEWGG